MLVKAGEGGGQGIASNQISEATLHALAKASFILFTQFGTPHHKIHVKTNVRPKNNSQETGRN